jgi:hypothetical protein
MNNVPTVYTDPHGMKGLSTDYVAFLNQKGVPARDFCKLTELLQAWTREQSTRRLKYREEKAWFRKTHPLCERFGKKYRSDRLPCLTDPSTGSKILFLDVPAKKHKKRLSDRDVDGWYAWGHLQTIVNAGLLLNIGHCKLDSCGRYFYGRVGKRFCSDKHAREYMRRTPQFKERNRKDQRKHYDKYFRAKPLARGRGNKKTRSRKSG